MKTVRSQKAWPDEVMNDFDADAKRMGSPTALLCLASLRMRTSLQTVPVWSLQRLTLGLGVGETLVSGYTETCPKCAARYARWIALTPALF